MSTVAAGADDVNPSNDGEGDRPGDGAVGSSSGPDWALHWGRLGYCVFPCTWPLPGGGCSCGDPTCADIGKHPAITNWQQEATKNEREIRRLWARFPEANIGILTGEPNKIVVLDVDPRNGGEKALEEHQAKFGALPPTPRTRTGGGGWHFLFQHPGVPVRNIKIAPGLELRADGGMVIGAGSVHRSGAGYLLEVSPEQVPPAPLPEWILRESRSAGKELTAASSATSADGRVPEGSRNTYLTTLAGSMRRKGMSESGITAGLLAENQARCDPPLAEAEIRKIAASIAGYDPGDPVLSEVTRTVATASTKAAILIRVSDVPSKQVAWVWPGRLAFEKVAILDGNPDQGKSLISLDIAARVSVGAPMPDGPPVGKAGVVILSAEDGIADTIRPRLEVAGADLDRVLVLDSIKEGTDERLPVIPDDITSIQEAIQKVEAGLVIIDPLMSFLSPRLRSANDQEVRRAMSALRGLAEKSRVAILVVRHLKKDRAEVEPLYRGGGSIGIIGGARLGLLVGPHPFDEAVRLLAATKTNLGPTPPTMGYRIEGMPNGAARVIWMGHFPLSARDILTILGDLGDLGALDRAVGVLRDFLSGGPVPAKEIEEKVKEVGIASRTLDRAKSCLRIESKKEGNRWIWLLPGRDGSHPAPPQDRQERQHRQGAGDPPQGDAATSFETDARTGGAADPGSDSAGREAGPEQISGGGNT